MPAEITASMYQAKSATQHGKDYQMFPKSPDLSTTFNEAITPAPSVIQERPNYVIANKAGTYNFLYQTTCSIGGTSGETFTQGAILTGAGSRIELPIQPVAWSGGGSTGDVTFVYVRVR